MKSIDQILPLAQKGIEEKRFLHIHPDWLFHSGGKTNHRGPYYEAIKILLEVDRDIDGLIVRKKPLQNGKLQRIRRVPL